jgi:hypothetical protein
MDFFLCPPNTRFWLATKLDLKSQFFILTLFKIQASKVRQTFSYSAECWNIFVAWYNEFV